MKDSHKMQQRFILKSLQFKNAVISKMITTLSLVEKLSFSIVS